MLSHENKTETMGFADPFGIFIIANADIIDSILATTFIQYIVWTSERI